MADHVEICENDRYVLNLVIELLSAIAPGLISRSTFVLPHGDWHCMYE